MIKEEWKSIFKNKTLAISISVLLFVPIIYSSIFLKAVWDPYGSTENLPVAVVNEDKAYDYDGKTLSVGEDMVDNLKDNDKFKWTFVDKSEAEKGLKDGKYYMVIEIPKDFSKNASTLLDETPKKLELVYKTNPSRSMTGQLITKQGATSINEEIRSSITKQYSESVFNQIKDLGDGLSDAAKGSLELKDGVSELQSGNKQITDNLNTLAQSTLTFTKGAKKLETGVDSLGSGVTQLSEGSSSLYSGVKSYTDGVGSIKANLDQVSALISQNPDMPQEQQLALYKQAVEGVSQGINQLDGSSEDLVNGAMSLKSGTETLNSNIPSLKEGTNALVDGANKISEGASKLSKGSGNLGEGLSKLNDGSSELSTSLKKGADKVSDTKISDNTYDMFSNPTNLVDKSITNVPIYGQGLAGYVLPLALFVGAITFGFIFQVDKPTGEVKSTLRWWVSKFSVMVMQGVLNALIMDLIMVNVVKLPVQNMSHLILVSIITSILFISIVVFLGSALGNIGRLSTTILLILQVACSGGLFPIEVTNKFYQGLNKLMPMTYSVKGFRESLAGGIGFSEFRSVILVLLGFLVAFNFLIMILLKLKGKKLVSE